MVIQLNDCLRHYRHALVLAPLIFLAACSSNERIIPPNPAVSSNPSLEARKIVDFRNQGQYENAYQQIKNWSLDINNLKKIFHSEPATIVALEICAWKPDQDLFNQIFNQSPSQHKAKKAYGSAASKNFDALHKYQLCFFKSAGPSLNGCANEIETINRYDPEYKDIWGKIKK